jgi:hypothetical protein
MRVTLTVRVRPALVADTAMLYEPLGVGAVEPEAVAALVSGMARATLQAETARRGRVAASRIRSPERFRNRCRGDGLQRAKAKSGVSSLCSE